MRSPRLSAGPEHAQATAPPARTRPTPAPTAKQPSLWRNRDYMGWWTGTLLSTVGSSTSAMAFPLLVVFATGSVFQAGVIAAAGRIGLLVTMLWGGALADRYSRRAILVAIPLAQAALMGVVAYSVRSGHVPVVLLSAAALGNGLLVGVKSGSILPALRRIVPREQFAARAAQEQGQAMAAQLAGSPLAAFLFVAARWLPFGADALSFVFASLGSAVIRRPLGPDRAEPAPGSGRRGVLGDIREGFRIVRRQDFLRYTTVWVAVTNLVGSSFMLLLIALLRQRGAGPRTIGVTNAAVLCGGVLGSLAAGLIIRRLRARRVFLLGGWIYVASLALAAVAGRPWQVGAAACAFTFASVPTVSVWEAYTARLVPDRLTGRVGSVSTFGAQSLAWVGLLLAGWLVDRFGAPTAVLCFAALLVPFAVAGHRAGALALFRTPLEQVEELP